MSISISLQNINSFFNFYNHCLFLDDFKLKIKDSLSPPKSFQYIYKKKNPRKR